MKDYFFFSKSQRIGIFLLLLIILVCIIVINILPRLVVKHGEEDIFLQEVQLFCDTATPTIKGDGVQQPIALFKFNPNTLDSVGFLSLGLKPFVAHNICKYRAKGGRFRKPQDFAKIHGLSEQQFLSLEPYIVIASESKEPDIISPTFSGADNRSTPKESNETKSQQLADLHININTCDTTELKLLPGIGSTFAKRIVGYRYKIGGYSNASQLLEVYGMDAERLQKITPYLVFDVSRLRKIYVNTASVERMKSHPYISFYVAKSIYDQRKKLGKLTSIDDLRNLSDIDDATLSKIAPYLSFE